MVISVVHCSNVKFLVIPIKRSRTLDWHVGLHTFVILTPRGC